MGRDKAQLIVQGQPLWKRQLEILQQTEPVELLISGSSDGPFRGAGCRIVSDEQPGQGPLGGLISALTATPGQWLLVLAVDLPFMTAEYLRELVREAIESGRGIIPAHANGELEPLAAVYPMAARDIAREQMQAGERKLARLIERLEVAGLVQRRQIAPGEAPLLRNWNAPADLKNAGE